MKIQAFCVKNILLISAVLCAVLLAYGVSKKHKTHLAHQNHGNSDYAGEEKRLIKSLSQQDVDALSNGSGWGLAKAAELNGVPGPLHLLELKDEIDLSPEQVVDIQHVFDEMHAQAVTTGKQLIASEQALEERFRSSLPSADELQTALSQIGKIRSHLRYVHLAAHLQTPTILSIDQIDRYNELRRYGDSDPCTNCLLYTSPSPRDRG